MSTEPEPNTASGFVSAALGTGLHAPLLLGLLVMYATYVPAAKKTFNEFGMTLPQLTVFVCQLSDVWWLLGLASGAFLVADFALIRWFRRYGTAHAVVWVLSAAMCLVLFAAMTVLAVELPMSQLRDALAR